MSDLSRFGVAFAAFIGLIDFIWGRVIGIGFPPITDFIFTALLATTFGTVGIYYTHFRRDITISRPCWSIFVFVLFMPVGAMYSYLTQTWNFPLADPAFVQLDAMLGFDWLVVVNWFISLPTWVSEWSTIIYKSSFKLILLTALFLVFSGRHRRLDEFIILFLLTSTVTVTISGFLPGENAFEYFKPDAQTAEKLSAIVGANSMEHFYGLRDGTLQALTLSKGQGVVAFPSFHTIVSLLLIYAWRGTGVFFVASIIWNVTIIATTPFDGAHYLVDIIGGIAVFALCVWLLRWLEPHIARFYSREYRRPAMPAQA